MGKPEWIDSMPIFKVIEKATKPGLPSLRREWTWLKNNRCKYINLRIDMRDGHCVLEDREGKEITLEELKYQYKSGD